MTEITLIGTILSVKTLLKIKEEHLQYLEDLAKDMHDDSVRQAIKQVLDTLNQIDEVIEELGGSSN
ncbi:MAG: hypothetical protein E6Q97_36435 [Desulfurellales bacterium]|nr:MAG: hypothetical protein E6Q97_36435 [Desulfurellales bacterium]